jgi:hypothetical protein
MKRSVAVRFIGVLLLLIVHTMPTESARDDLGLPTVQRGDVRLEVERVTAERDPDHRASYTITESANGRAVADDRIP